MDLSLENETIYLIGLGLLIVVLAGLLYISWKNRYFSKKK
jgi:LPXTG-motif cell wall-anchored protein